MGEALRWIKSAVANAPCGQMCPLLRASRAPKSFAGDAGGAIAFRKTVRNPN